MHTRLSFILLLFILSANFSYAQQCIIKGKVQDTLNQMYLPHAAVTLVHAADSIMETFARTKDDGSFELHTATGDRYLIMITYPGFADYVDIITVKDGKTKDMGNIPMVTRSHLLTEFVFQQNRGAIKIKGDTIEYVADSFQTKDNATVEDLLKKLPGMQVDKNGQVTAQGEKVQKILVDGEEFFSDDPAVVTKNLQANAVDKVQVFDKKSDQAEFTGIDDGVKIKTIDLKLKEDKKKGYFGKVIGGGGAGDNGAGKNNKGYYENQAMINRFKGKMQMSVFGVMSNTGRVGLGWNDADKYGTSSTNSEMSDDGFYYSYSTNDDDISWNGTYNGEGLPTAWTAGAHFANKWNEDKSHINANYRFAKQNVESGGNTTTQYIVPGSSYTTKETNSSSSNAIRHNLSGTYEWKPDTSSSLKITFGGNYANTQTRSHYTNESRTADGDTLRSNGTRSLNTDATSKKENIEALYRKRFKKKGRTISVNVTENYKEANSTSFLQSSNTYYTDTIGNFTMPTNQEKINASSTFSLSGKLEYTEPLSKVAYIDASYALRVDNSAAAKTSLDTNNTDRSYTDTNTLYTSNYAYNVLVNSGALALRFVYKKFNFSFGGTVSNADYKQQDLRHDTAYNYNYLNFFPKANFNYKFENQASLSFSYTGGTRQPTLQQVQPLLDNTDPNNIATGNPDLRQEFRHTFNAHYNGYKVLSGRYIWAGGSFNLIQNAITRVDDVQFGTQRIYHYENMNGNYAASLFAGYGSRIPKTDIQAGFWSSVNLAHSNSKVNKQANVSDNNVYTLGPRLDYNKKDKFELSFNPQLNYNDNKSTISANAISYWSTDLSLSGSVQLPLKFEIGTDIDWYIREKTKVFPTNNNVFKWNAYVSKKFLKKSQLELRAAAFDILNQNIGFSRYAESNYIYENRYNTVRRYGLISLIWNFTKTAAGVTAPENEGGIKIGK